MHRKIPEEADIQNSDLIAVVTQNLIIYFRGQVGNELVYILVKPNGSSTKVCPGDSEGPVFYMWSQRIDSMTVYYANVLGITKATNAERTVLVADEALNRLQVYLYIRIDHESAVTYFNTRNVNPCGTPD
jgi:hypothetical protein